MKVGIIHHQQQTILEAFLASNNLLESLNLSRRSTQPNRLGAYAA
jgi:hypothetical protein